MNLTKVTNKSSIDYPIIGGDKKGTLYLSPELKSQIDIFHSFAGSTEWSGILLYTIDKGDIFDPAKLKIIAKGMFPMDIGSPGYTEYDYDENTLDMYDFYPKALEEEWRLGHIHSHHNMKAYFSGTDLQELRDNIDNHVYYLSLIVNFDGEYCAKVCVKGSRTVKEDSVLEYKGLLSDKSTVQRHKQEREEDIVYTVDLNIEVPEVEAEPSFIKELLKLKKRQNEKKVASSTYNRNWYGRGETSAHSNYRGNQLNIWDDTHSIRNNGDTREDLNKEREVNSFLAKLVNVDPDYHLVTVLEKEVKNLKKKYDNMTTVDKGLYLSYMEDNINSIIGRLSLDSRDFETENEKVKDLCEDAVLVLEAWTSSSYGYSSYEKEHFVDEVVNILEAYADKISDSLCSGGMDW